MTRARVTDNHFFHKVDCPLMLYATAVVDVAKSILLSASMQPLISTVSWSYDDDDANHDEKLFSCNGSTGQGQGTPKLFPKLA